MSNPNQYNSIRQHPTARFYLSNWLIDFFFIETFILSLISLRYQSVSFVPETALAKAFNVVMTLGHFALLSLVVLLPLLILGLLWPKLRIFITLAVVLSFLLNFIILIDTYVFQLYRFHLNSAVLELFFGPASGEIFIFSPIMYLKIILFAAGLFVLQVVTAKLIWNRVALQKSYGRVALVFLIVIIFIQNIAFGFADAFAYTPITVQSTILPGYFPITFRKKLVKLGIEISNNDDHDLSSPLSGALNYPLSPLNCSGDQSRPRLNILFLIIDSWRFDAFSSEITPNIAELANSESGIRFTNHWSGGSATRTGIFSIFYGLPGTYWHHFLAGRIGPVLVGHCVHHAYKFPIFGNAPLISPEFDKTVFADVKGLQIGIEGVSISDRDIGLNNHFFAFLEQNKTKAPFLGMLFYDAPHDFALPDDAPRPFQPSLETVDYTALNPSYDRVPFHNLYLNSVHFVDSLVGQVVKTLKQYNLYDNTIIFVTGDHGQEFNENGKNFWGHNGNFSNYQIQVPLVVHWPGKNKAEYSHWTSHVDIVPTLMTTVFGCSNPVSDYSVGRNLFSPAPRQFLLLANYSSYGIVEPERITTFNPHGRLEVTDSRLQPLINAAPSSDIINQAFEQRSRFLK